MAPLPYVGASADKRDKNIKIKFYSLTYGGKLMTNVYEYKKSERSVPNKILSDGWREFSNSG